VRSDVGGSRNVHVPLAAVVVFEYRGVRPKLYAAYVLPPATKFQIAFHILHSVVESAPAAQRFRPILERHGPFPE
jgi:hypothetical protein